jgi:hypothetical protein
MILQKKNSAWKKLHEKFSRKNFRRKKRIRIFSGTKIILQKNFSVKKLHEKFSRKISAEKNESKIFLEQK